MATKPSSAQSKRSRRAGASSQSAQEPGSEAPLSLERIIATAVELLDAGGVDGLKMRRLADRLGAGAMSLYWHVGNKDEVFDLALDSVLEYHGPPSAAELQDWRAEVVHMLDDWRASMLRHPWSASLLPRRALGPNILTRLELLSKTLSGDVGNPAFTGHDHRRAVAVRRRVVEVLRIDDGQLEIILIRCRRSGNCHAHDD